VQKEQKPIRVMLADDHPIVMTGFALSLSAQGMEVVGQAKSPSEAAAMYAEFRPDVAVLDIRFGTELTGMDAAQNILRNDPKAKIVFLSQFDQDSLIKETYRLGAHAFVTKDCDPADLADAVRHAHAGKLYFLPQIAERLNLSTKTISNISQSVKEKLGVHRQAYITKLAVKHGLIEP
jgi:DNA-binding NarL/FixJ family response regulator